MLVNIKDGWHSFSLWREQKWHGVLKEMELKEKNYDKMKPHPSFKLYPPSSTLALCNPDPLEILDVILLTLWALSDKVNIANFRGHIWNNPVQQCHGYLHITTLCNEVCIKEICHIMSWFSLHPNLFTLVFLPRAQQPSHSPPHWKLIFISISIIYPNGAHINTSYPVMKHQL